MITPPAMSVWFFFCSWILHVYNYNILLPSHFSARIVSAGRKGADDIQAVPQLEDPSKVDDSCLIQKTKLQTALKGPPPCRDSLEGMTRCCNCAYHKQYEWLLSEIPRLWEKYGHTGRLGNTFLKPPNPADLGHIDLQHIFEADDAKRDVGGVVYFRCYLTITPQQQAMFFEILQFYRDVTLRMYHKAKGIAMRTKQLTVMCGPAHVWNFKDFPSLRHHIDPAAGVTEVPTVRSGRCVPKDELPANYWVEQRKRHKPYEYHYQVRWPKLMTIAPVGATKCLEVPRLQEPTSPLDQPEVEVVAVVASALENSKAVAEFTNNPIELSSDEEDAYYHAQMQEVMADYLKLKSTSYEASHPGQYATRTIEEAGPSNYLSFSLPESATRPGTGLPDLNLPSEESRAANHEMMQICTSINPASTEQGYLFAGWKALPES